MKAGSEMTGVGRRLSVTFLLATIVPAGAVALIAFGHGAPIGDFGTPYPYITLGALGFGVVVGLLQISRSLAPLLELREGTKRLAAGQLTVQVKVDSGDEFQEVASSINAMADRIHGHMRVLKAVHDVGRTVQATLDIEKIIEAVLSRTPDITPCDAVLFALAPTDHGVREWTVSASSAWGTHNVSIKARPTVTEVNELRKHGHFALDAEKSARTYLNIEVFAARGIRHFLIFPIVRDKSHVVGAMSLGYRQAPSMSAEDLTRTRRFADQVSVALAHGRIMKELNSLNLGTLNALARTIDASSKWTAGHSERVTYMALEIGKMLRLPPAALETLHRGGLLHDIGKIGVPSAILNKPGRLDDDEMRVMQNHTRMGAEILAPLPQYADALPIVRHHHEKMDGTGYPDRLRGNQIPVLARLLAVADVFDALRAERPYRGAMPEEKVIAIIEEMSGDHLDPKAVKAFLAVMASRKNQTDTGSELPYARDSMVMRQVTLADGLD